MTSLTATTLIPTYSKPWQLIVSLAELFLAELAELRACFCVKFGSQQLSLVTNINDYKNRMENQTT